MKSQDTPLTAAQAGIIWELRPRTALPDLIARNKDQSLPQADRLMALDTLGQMQWPEAARALEAFILAPSAPAPLVERAFNLYSHQLFSCGSTRARPPRCPMS